MFLKNSKKENPLQLFFTIWKFLKVKTKKQVFLLIFLMLLSGLAELISLGSLIPFISLITNPDLIYQKINTNLLIRFLGYQNYESIFLLFFIIFVISILLSTTIRVLNLLLTEKMVEIIGSQLSCEAYRKTLYQNYSVQIERNSSEILKTITIQVDNTINTINSFLKMIASFAIVIFIFGFLIYTSWFVALKITFTLTILYSLINLVTRNVLLKNSKIVNNLRFQQIKVIQESLGSIRDVIINKKQFQFSKYYSKVDIKLRKWLAINRILINSPKLIIEGVGLLLLSIISFILISNTKDSTKVIPIMAVFALGSQKMLPSVQQIFKSFASIKSNSYDLRSVVRLLEQKLDEKEINKKSKVLDLKKINFEKVSFKYTNSNRYNLKDLNASILKGETIGIIGKTGSGKSTFIDLFMGLLDPTEGNIFINSSKLQNNNQLKQSLFESISHVPQDIYLLDTSIAENIAFDINSSKIDYTLLEESAKRAQIFDYVNSLPNKFETKVGERGINLSGGQKQRIAIARAFYKNAPIIVFDEATSALDNKTEKLIMDSFKSLDKKITVLLVAHRISSLKNCSKIFKFEKGYLKEVSEVF